jgi:hypothetical protein
MKVTSYVDELDSVDNMERYTPSPFMCLVEQTRGGNTGDISVGMITICPSTGDVVWDDFDGRYLCFVTNSSSNESLADTLMRIELEVSGSTCTDAVSNKWLILDKTRSHKTDRSTFT